MLRGQQGAALSTTYTGRSGYGTTAALPIDDFVENAGMPPGTGHTGAR
jgi:hypothetical protein